MPSPTLTPSLLSTLGPSASAPAALLAAQQARESQPGAFARELQKMQTQAPVVSPPPPPQPKPPAQPPTLPPARPTGGSATGSATGSTTQATGSGSGTGSSGSRDSVAATKPDTAGSDGPAKPSEPTLDRQRQRLRSSRSDGDASVTRVRTGRSDAGADGQASRADRIDHSERAARRRPSDTDSAADPSVTAATAAAQPAPALPPTGQPLPTRAALQAGADSNLLGPQPDARTAGSEPDAPRVPGIDLLNGRGETLAAGTAVAADAPATPRAPQRPAAAGDTVPSLAAEGKAGPGARPQDLATSAELQAVIAGRQDDPSSALQAATTGPQPALPSFAAELARASGTNPAAAPAAAAPPAELTLPTPVTAPDFLPRLGGELALLARDGVQEARINVHPVELGPISVQIALDGTAAQVHLAVDNAQTRELLEQAMPTLAAALRDTGLTLTGGGVFQQSRQSQQEQAATDKRSLGTGRLGGDDGDTDLNRLAAATPRRLRPLGALDVFA